MKCGGIRTQKKKSQNRLNNLERYVMELSAGILNDIKIFIFENLQINIFNSFIEEALLEYNTQYKKYILYENYVFTHLFEYSILHLKTIITLVILFLNEYIDITLR